MTRSTTPNLTLRALVRGSAQRLTPVTATLETRTRRPAGRCVFWTVSEKRLAPLHGFRSTALPGQSLVVYDPDPGLVMDVLACEDTHASEYGGPAAAGQRAAGRTVDADRHFCTRTVLQSWQDAGAGFIEREHAHHPRLVCQADWQGSGLPQPARCAGKRSRWPVYWHHGGASNPRWMRPPRTVNHHPAVAQPPGPCCNRTRNHATSSKTMKGECILHGRIMADTVRRFACAKCYVNRAFRRKNPSA
jgi:hypothetical protein